MDRGKVSRRKFLQLGAMAGGAMALAACPAAPAEAPTAAPEDSSDDDMPMAEMLDLTLLSLKGTGWPKFNNFIVENFMEQTGHGATLQEAQWPIRDTVIPAIAAGTPPDVVHDMGKMSGALYIEGAYLTLNDLVDAAPFSPGRLYRRRHRFAYLLRRYQEDPVLAQHGPDRCACLPQGLSSTRPASRNPQPRTPGIPTMTSGTGPANSRSRTPAATSRASAGTTSA